MLTGSKLQCLEYFPQTGEWFWRDPPNHNTRLFNKLAGNRRADGYLRIRIDGIAYYSSRLAFLWMLGRWPYDEVDHKDRDPSNDRWENLRDATSSDNKYNRDLGFRGAHRGVYRSGEETWWAMTGGVYLGTYPSLEEAVAAREEALVRMGAEAFAITDETLLERKLP
jgi:hypothetical protein